MSVCIAMYVESIGCVCMYSRRCVRFYCRFDKMSAIHEMSLEDIREIGYMKKGHAFQIMAAIN